MASAVTGEDRRRAKELDEARKAGLAPAELDEEGKEINPHIPEYMTSAPWYLNSNHPTLKHQRDWRLKDGDDKQWYDRGAKTFQATKYRKGACDNCGSMSHPTKDCLERPRCKGAKWTGKNIAADDKIEDIKLTGFESKRDRWNGFDAKDYSQVVERYEQLDHIRKEIKKKEQVSRIYAGRSVENGDGDDHRQEGDGEVDDDDEEKIAEEDEAGFGDVKKRVRTAGGGATGSVRNLRIREDTAKYLLNLDPTSAHYDPKSRSMREDPCPDKPESEKTFIGDNNVRKTGDYAAWQSLTVHSMEAMEKGMDVHMQANPSLAEVLYKQFRAKKDVLAKDSKQDVRERYGADASTQKAPEELLLMGQTERYVEYDRFGRVVRGIENRAKSRYEEDIHPSNHTSCWGSFWRDGSWGYSCCHSHVRNSYCTGKAGEAAVRAVAEQMSANVAFKAREGAEAADLKRREESKLVGYKGVADVWGEAAPEAELDPKKVEAALKRLREAEAAAVASDGSKGAFNSLAGGAENVTAEEMEAYRLKKSRVEDPMAALISSKGVGGNSGYDFV